jgi:hypothetical protein
MSSANYRAEKSGFAKAVQEKLAEKFDGQEAAKALKWISLLPAAANQPDYIRQAVSKLPTNATNVTPDQFHECLFDGLVLGHIMSSLQPNSVNWSNKTWQVSDKPVFETSRQRERISLYLNFATSFGVNSAFNFQTDQLYEKTDLCQVVICIANLGSTAQSKPDYRGPQGFWTQKHHENKREFTEEQLRSGQTVIGLQMGTNQVANASGVSFGAQRRINDSY